MLTCNHLNTFLNKWELILYNVSDIFFYFKKWAAFTHLYSSLNNTIAGSNTASLLSTHLAPNLFSAMKITFLSTSLQISMFVWIEHMLSKI